ncbi:hypothetical protein TNCV_4418371 [Trichonephila clavipes]|nr:hypothetical protein TNCV_4418371 [Trichonephila clavipes]
MNSKKGTADVLIVNGDVDCSGNDTPGLYQECYPNRRVEHHTTFANFLICAFRVVSVPSTHPVSLSSGSKSSRRIISRDMRIPDIENLSDLVIGFPLTIHQQGNFYSLPKCGGVPFMLYMGCRFKIRYAVLQLALALAMSPILKRER